MLPVDVLNMAKYYGVDLRKSPFLLPLIKQAIETPLPPNWIEVEDNAENELNDNFESAPLYMNELSGATQREHPADAYFRQQIEATQKEYDGRECSAWLEFNDGERKFYYDFATNTEQEMYPSAGLMTNAQHIRIPKEVFARAVEIHRQPKSKAIEQLDILCFHSSWKEACQGVVQTQHADIYFSISTKHFQFVLGNCEHIYTISHINGRDGKPLEAWDLRVGGKITILGRQTTLMTVLWTPYQWLFTCSLGEHAHFAMDKLSTELKKYDAHHRDTKYKAPIESPEIRKSRNGLCLRSLRHEIDQLRDRLAKYRPDLARKLVEKLHE